MRLDYVDTTGAFTLSVPRSNGGLVQVLVKEHGLSLSLSASTASDALLFTREPYAAVAFWEYATDRARQRLVGLQTEIEKSWRSESNVHIRCPADRELWPFQRADVEYVVNRTHALVGDEPGLGKTPVAICVANEIRAKRVLVICPASIRLQWVRRIREWTTMDYPYIIYPILTSQYGVHPTAHWTVVSYDLIRVPQIAAALSKGTYDLLILDEAHYLKSWDAQRTRAVFGGGTDHGWPSLASRSQRILALTGTPLPNRPREAYVLARNLCWDSIDWASEEGFRERFNPSFKGEVDGKVFIEERNGRHAELQARLRVNFMVRHLKRVVLPQLQLPVYDLIQVSNTSIVRQALQAESLLAINPDSLAGADATVLGHIAVVRRQMGVAMAPQVADYVEMLIRGGEEKLVLFAWHHEVMDILEARLKKHGLVRIDGSTGTVRKEQRVQEFVENPAINVCLGNLQSMGIGTDGLQAVSCHALIAEPSWTPGDNVQAFDRLDRGGQRRAVQGDVFVAPGSIADRVLASALRKLQVTHAALDRRF